MPSKARTAPSRRPSAVQGPPVTGDGQHPAAGQLTPHDVADLINRGKLTGADGDALIDELDQRRLKPARPATFAVPIAVPVPADTRPAAAMARLDNTVQGAVAAMTWTTLHDIDGYVIDAPQRAEDRASGAGQPSSTGGDVALVRANVLLTVTVVAYVLHHFAGTVQQLLDEDLQHLRDAGVDTGPPRRAPAPSEEDPDKDFLYPAWRPRGDWDEPASYDYYDYEGSPGDPDGDEALVDLDPASYERYPLYDEDELFGEDPADALFIGHGLRW
ncbi:hypothetical protein [Virgisporangium aurantiacum]|uniref:Uncharacterized protein n=1 Tax=Virgisporangium aurantiacum TaxID=175570 RepID=A0A8J4E5E7_9ACTN|nr:hypothetical protein [Virgisporangium aurantiacum]GIJ62023.1 hypothetical protein Vau01_095390 [Virgisporangium aurantiacum]